VLDLLIRDARIRTVDPRRPTATAVGIWQGLIVGLDEDVLSLPARATIVADGAVIVPVSMTRTATPPATGSAWSCSI
jgi:predicted amidohydrolase YtcJ